MKEEYNYHESVLLTESVEALAIKPDGIYVDVTFGGGGHSRKILERLNDNGRLFAFDQDEDALQNAPSDARFTLINQNFKHLKRYLKFYKITEVDGVLADLGVSSFQFDQPNRGFSLRFEGQLDMRMDKRNNLSAYEIINNRSQDQLIRIFKDYGELRNAFKFAQLIVEARRKNPIKTTQDLKESVSRLLPRGKENKVLAQLYQAVRIEVNGEMESLMAFLEQTAEVIKTGGRLSVISYHSLEDRLVKQYIREGRFEGEAEQDFFGNRTVPFKKVGGLITPSEVEIRQNNRSRSAKLRIAQRL